MKGHVEMMKRHIYFTNTNIVRHAKEDTIPQPHKNEIVVFKSFFKDVLHFPLHKMVVGVLKKFEIYLHQLTPNTTIRRSIYMGGSKPRC
jgi:hypothetical protein